MENPSDRAVKIAKSNAYTLHWTVLMDSAGHFNYSTSERIILFTNPGVVKGRVFTLLHAITSVHGTATSVRHGLI